MATDQELKTAVEERQKFKDEANNVKGILESLIERLENFVLAARFLLYGGSVALSWFYLHDKVLAVGIVCSLTAAHILIMFMDWLHEKKEQLTKRTYF